VGGGGHKERGSEVNMGMNFMSRYENRRMTPADIVLGRRKREEDGGSESN
jgi:hypothetical protein